MREMGLEAIYPKPHLNQSHPEHKIYPYLLKDVSIKSEKSGLGNRYNLYSPRQRGFMYLVAVMDWWSRYVLAWQMSASNVPECN